MTVVVKSGSKDKFNPMQHTIIGQISYEKVTNLRRMPTSVYYSQVHDLELNWCPAIEQATLLRTFKENSQG